MSAERDLPAKVVAIAISWMPIQRREWGLAMAGELAHVEGSAARWRFAFGCLRVAMTPQRPQRDAASAWVAVAGGMVLLAPLVIAPSVSALTRAAWVTGTLLASVTVYGLYMAALIVSEPRPSTTSETPNAPYRRSAPRDLILVGVAAALALDVFVLVRYPELRTQGADSMLGYIATALVEGAVAAILGAYVWLAVTRTRNRSAEAMIARRYGMVAGLITGALLVAAAHAPNPSAPTMAAAGACAALAGHLASRAASDPRTGLVTGVWAGAIAGLTLFVVGAGLILVTGFPSHSATIAADFHAGNFHDLRSFAVAGAFGLDGDPPLVGALVPLVFVPLLCAGLAAFGATRGGRQHRRPTPLPNR